MGEHAGVSAPNPSPALALGRRLLVDAGTPLAVYYGLRASGVGDVVALLAGGLVPAGAAVVTAVRQRRVEPIAVAVLLGMVLSAALSLLTDDPRELLVRGAWLSLPFGLWFLATLLRPQQRPFCFEATCTLLPHHVRVMDELWATDAGFRRTWRVITGVWAGALIVAAPLHILMAYTLPVPVVPALDTALSIGTVVALQIPTHVLLRRSGTWDLLFRPHAMPRSPRRAGSPSDAGVGIPHPSTGVSGNDHGRSAA